MILLLKKGRASAFESPIEVGAYTINYVLQGSGNRNPADPTKLGYAG
jgi:hypothetical protein